MTTPIGGDFKGTPSQDKTPPPAPRVQQAVAYDPIRRDDAQVGATGRGDPAYLEFSNIEAGTTLQVINRSRLPSASFEANATKLTFDANDLKGRRVGVSFTDAQMKELDLRPGDKLSVRAVDAAGNASMPVTFELTGAANREIRIMKDDFEDRIVFAKPVPDGRPPVLSLPGLRLFKAESKDATVVVPVTVEGKGVAEPGAIVTVQNSRTGLQQVTRVNDEGTFKANLVMEAGDGIVFSATDSNSMLQVKPLTISYSPGSEQGFTAPAPDIGWSAEANIGAPAPAPTERPVLKLVVKK